MDKKTVFIKTAKGEREGADLSSDLKRILSLIDNKSKADELSKRAPPSLREGWMDLLAELVEDGYIRDKNKPFSEPKIIAPKSSLLNMFTPKPSDEAHKEELDYNTAYSAPVPSAAEQAAKRKADEAARVRAEMEAAVSIAKNRASAEAAAKAGAKARQEAENAARAKALVEAEDARKAEYKARKDAESAERAKAAAAAEARVKAKQEAELRAQAEIRAKQAAAAKLREQQEAARARAALEEAARVRAEIEAAARAQQIAEAKARQEMEARMKAEQEAARVKAALEAAAKARIEEEARVRAELEAAKARAEAEAKALAEALARKAAEEKARLAAEAEAKALAEALARKAAEENARLAAAARAEQEAAARIRAEAEIKAATDELARQQQAAAKREADISSPPAANGFEINLDGFLDGAQTTRGASVPSGQYVRQASAEDDDTQRAATGPKAGTATRSASDIAAEMARLKNEAEATRRQLEEEARRQAEEKALSEEQSRAWEEAEQRATVQAVIEVEQAAQQAALQQAKSAHTPVTRKKSKPLPVGRIVFVLSALALIVAAILPYVYPLNDYIAPLEQRLSALLKQPVRIGGMSATTFPPTLKLQSVVVGNQQEVKVGNIRLNFDVFSLPSDIKVVSNAELEDVSIQGSQLEKQVASLKLLGGDAQYPVHHLTLQRIQIVTDEIALPVLSGIADLGAQGTFHRVSLHSADDKLDIDLQSNPEHWLVSLNLRESSLPILPDIVFSDLSAKGELRDGEVNFTEMDAHIFNGILLGKAKLSWSKGWELQGSLEAKTFDLDKMFPKYHLVGEVYGEGKFSMSANKLSGMGGEPRLDGSFSVKKGTINIDMVETARLFSRESLVGGRTHFDDMIGLVQMDNGSIHFRQIKIASAMLSSQGAFDVSENDRISGHFNAEIKMREGKNQLTLFGTLDEPKLRAGN